MSEDINLLKVQIKAELQRLEANSSAKDVEGDHVTVTKGDDTVRAKK